MTAITTAGVAYVTGVRVFKSATSKTYTASKDTYVDLNSAGTYTYVAVANGAGAPAITADSLRLAKVVTSGTAVTSVEVMAAINTTYGISAGLAMTTGYENTLIGNNAGESITTGFSNAAFGPYAGNHITTGYENVCFGPYSGQNITDGYTNTLIGAESGYNLTSGDSNIFIGKMAGVTATGGNATTIGSQNIFIGNNTGSANATQRYSAIAIGEGATISIDDAWVIGKLGTKQAIKEGTNGCMGLATLVAGTVTVNTNKVTANSRIFLTPNVPGGTPGWVRVSARVAGTSFTILSSSGTDTSGIAWEIKEPA